MCLETPHSGGFVELIQGSRCPQASFTYSYSHSLDEGRCDGQSHRSNMVHSWNTAPYILLLAILANYNSPSTAFHLNLLHMRHQPLNDCQSNQLRVQGICIRVAYRICMSHAYRVKEDIQNLDHQELVPVNQPRSNPACMGESGLNLPLFRAVCHTFPGAAAADPQLQP